MMGHRGKIKSPYDMDAVTGHKRTSGKETKRRLARVHRRKRRQELK